MKDLISKADVLETYAGLYDTFEDNQFIRKELNKVYDKLNGLPYAQPEQCDDPRADVYYLAEKIGIHWLYALVVELRGEPKPCEDAVSREAVYEAMVEKGQRSRRYRLGETWELNGTEIREALDTVPSVTPKRKTGKWIEYDSDDDKYDVIKCPCCKHIFTVDAYHWTDIGFVKGDFKFCPNCNADMRGKQE